VSDLSVAISTTGNTFAGSITGMIWAYYALGEYCEENGVPGYQANGDTLIQGKTYKDVVWNTIQYGKTADVRMKDNHCT
jgi:hypothetical protein